MGNLNCGGICNDTSRGKDELLLQADENKAKLEMYQKQLTDLLQQQQDLQNGLDNIKPEERAEAERKLAEIKEKREEFEQLA